VVSGSGGTVSVSASLIATTPGGGFGGGGSGCTTHVHGHTFTSAHGDPSHAFGHSSGDARHGHHFTCSNHAPGHSPFGLRVDPGDETGFVAGLNEDGSVNGVAPARRGTVVQLFGSAAGLFVGEGDTPAVSFTPPASGSPLFTTAVPDVRVGGVPAMVRFSGLAPGLRGVWQLNIQIPENAPTGEAVPLTVGHEGREIRSVPISVE